MHRHPALAVDHLDRRDNLLVSLGGHVEGEDPQFAIPIRGKAELQELPGRIGLDHAVVEIGKRAGMEPRVRERGAGNDLEPG